MTSKKLLDESFQLSHDLKLSMTKGKRKGAERKKPTIAVRHCLFQSGFQVIDEVGHLFDAHTDSNQGI
jgi:hypothetical protein